jgi:hypothetical protein
MDVINLDAAPAFITKDGSEIRELLAYRNSSLRAQSLAEARLPVGGATQEHFHKQDRGDLLHHARNGPHADRKRNARSQPGRCDCNSARVEA